MHVRPTLFERIDPASLVVFRVVYGLMAAVSAGRFLWYGWVDRFFYQRDFFFHFPGFEWAVPLPAPGMHLLFGLLVAAGLCVAAGLFYRGSLAVFLLGFTYVGLIDTTNYLNHYWLFRFVGLLMLFMPLGAVASVDARRRRKDPPAFRGWMVWTLRGQLGIVYFFAGVAKLNWDWLVRGQPLEIWLNARTHLPVIGPYLAADWVPQVMSVAGALFDLSVAFLLIVPVTRPFAYLAVVCFHGATGFLFNIGMFPVIMIGSTTIFFEPDWPRRWLPDRRSALDQASDASRTLSAGRRRWVTVGLAAWFALQLALPLRPLVYPGDVHWTQEGFRFSWRVKLVERGGSLTYRVRDPESGESWVVHPSRYLTRRQTELASSDPSKILQLAHAIAADFRTRGHPDVAVYADVRVSLNGRPSRRLIDPTVDLADQRRSLWPKSWILRWDEAGDYSAADSTDRP
ncbi:MAG: HTTM domain-containing protein [Bradymonadaceae bacterium]